MDIEFWEWPVLVDLFDKGELRHVRQFLVEFHARATDDIELYRRHLLLLGELEALGFRRFHNHLNPWGPLKNEYYPYLRPCAYELCYVNTNYVRQQEQIH